ncbi:MAG: MoaD/ThiS family protein [Chloroflexi bacterium]|nr:MoaD/ThiS family protein [Chloroflexota bacterium]
MAITLFVPTPLRKLTSGNSKVQLSAASIADLIEQAETQYPGFRERVMERGEIKRFINVFVNGVDIRTLQGQATPIKDGDEVSVIPAMAGGSSLSPSGRGVG